ncbi:carboxymuconolactone decarboxylase family protein [Pseudodonghicola flavimaris]|uniref:Carboxymuconolactone decarboxylase family protein n=1 Tax=Pseudodonghicola flavimaris TaxID=3050036 RepID=A0ABT7F3V4_9RHOB|nr:carboxymuconolactone decarboxylase family protein [Pseudodonghicola flavimaris]MDK3019294.1 carboxymuconolactone decarboxylase family protein [Pseudodonghicola flavimaris]
MSWTTTLADAQAGMEDFTATQGPTAEGFGALHGASMEAGSLGVKQKELMALAIGISKQCIDCIAFHVKAAVEAGATRQDIEETVGVCILMGGGPAYMYGVKALKAFDEFTA